MKCSGAFSPRNGQDKVYQHPAGDVQPIQATSGAASGTHAVAVRPRGQAVPRPVRRHRHRVRGALSSVRNTGYTISMNNQRFPLPIQGTSGATSRTYMQQLDDCARKHYLYTYRDVIFLFFISISITILIYWAKSLGNYMSWNIMRTVTSLEFSGFLSVISSLYSGIPQHCDFGWEI